MKAIKLATCISALTLLAACSTPQQLTLDDGTVAWRIDCSRSAGLNYCFERAGKSCGAAGYSLVSPEGRVIATSSATGEIEEGDQFTQEVTYENSILVKCNDT
ncbi:MAG: hypothetical protein QNJ00_07715 [Woeseiaceae bacterium]|nr:hypothetical protein [Woeseiaceae bacterium]